MTQRRESGQALLIGVFILLLLLIAIPVTILLNQVSTQHGIMSQKKLKGRSIAEEGIAYAIQQLETASSVNCAGHNFDGSTILNSSQGNAFTISCQNGAPQSYETLLTAVPKDLSTNADTPPTIPGSSIQAIISTRTVAVQMANGFATPAAVQLGVVPNTPGDFRVYWGPILLLDSHPWTIPGAPANPDMNSFQYPRKYSIGPIQGTGLSNTYTTDPNASVGRCATDCNCASHTDQKEYWACASLGFSNPIDTGTYQALAAARNDILPAPICSLDGVTPVQATNLSGTQVTGGGYFDMTSPQSNCQGGTAIFDTNYSVPPSDPVIFVNGNAQFNSVHMDFKQTGSTGGGGFIVMGGNLTINGTPLISGAADSLKMPPSASLDYPYSLPAGNSGSIIPYCTGNQCPTTAAWVVGAPVQLPFRGFLYVQGNVTVQPNSTPVNSNFQMSGVARVDGLLTVSANNQFIVWYDDDIGHKIKTSHFELQVDSTTAIP